MPFKRGENPNKPKAGLTIRVEPIRDRAAIKRIKKLLRDQPRDLCLFTLGINTAFRANELLSIKVGQVRSLGVGDVLEVKQSKTDKCRQVTLNKTVVEAILGWLDSTDLGDSEFLFKSQLRIFQTSAPSCMNFGTPKK